MKFYIVKVIKFNSFKSYYEFIYKLLIKNIKKKNNNNNNFENNRL